MKGSTMRFLVLLGRDILIALPLVWILAMVSLGLDRVSRNGLDAGFIIGGLYFWFIGVAFALLFQKWITEYADTYYPKRAP
jgi:hypothetical protein